VRDRLVVGALRGEQAAALHRGRLRPGGLAAEDVLRRRHAQARVAAGPAAGQPHRRRLGDGTAAKFSSNAHTGGICFGDSGGPIFTAGTTTIVAINSYVMNTPCAGTTGGYRIDQADDLAFLARFGITP
jgi:hypothetical protein